MIIHDVSLTDFGLLSAIVIGSTYIYNRGSFLPKTGPHRQLFYEKPQKDDETRLASHATRDMGVKARDTGAHVFILWGSQSGTAETLANRLARDFQQRLKLVAVVGDLCDYDPATLAELPESTFLVLLMSTYGEGDPSDNAHDFVSFVATRSAGLLSNVQFTAFGCGNSSYRCYNKAVQDASSAMERNGAKLIFPVGTGDEALRSTHEDFLEWKEGFFAHLVSSSGMEDYKVEYQPSVSISKIEETSEAHFETSKPHHTHREHKIVRLPIISRKSVAVYHTQTRRCIDLKLDLSGHDQVKYRTGDHVAIWPRNPSEEVNLLSRVLGRESQKGDYIRISPADESSEIRVPAVTTLEALFTQHLDICSPVRRETILALVGLAHSKIVKRELEKIAHSRGAYEVFLEHNYLTLARLLELTTTFDPEVSWASLPLSFIIDFIPAMQPRLYSISTSSNVEPRQVGIVVSVKPGTVAKRSDIMIHGVASRFLYETPIKAPGVTDESRLVNAEIRRSAFKLPANSKTPVVMVAAGTGIAPFRAFIHERARLASIRREVGPMLLFFGSQSQDDCLFHDELSEVASRQYHTPFNLQIFTAFSRPEGNGAEVSTKMYVQDQVARNIDRVMQHVLEEDACFYICGATRMAKSVGEVILEAAQKIRQWSPEAASDWRQRKKRTSRWHEDVWG